MEKFVKQFGPLVIVAFISGFVGAAVFQGLSSDGTSFDGVPSGAEGDKQQRVVEQRTYVEESEAIAAIEESSPAVINIIATKDLQILRQQSPFDFFFFDDPLFEQFGFPFRRQQREQQPPEQPRGQEEPEFERRQVAGGTGFIVQKDGLAVTNKHVVNDTEADYLAILPDGSEYDVEIISRDPVNDLAIIQLHEKAADENGRRTGEKRNFGAEPKNLPVIALGDSLKVRVGQRVFAIGYARGEYENSVTAGIVSATGRQIQASDRGGSFQETLSNLIQTDAAINFGNSGGPLINLAGEVIGVNTAIDASASGIGFAIPINEVKSVLESVKKHGRIVRPALGVRFITLNEKRVTEFGLKNFNFDYGALIVGDRSKGETPILPGSPAEKVDLRVDDIILEADGEKLTDDRPLHIVVREHVPGDKIALKVWRAGSTFIVNVTLDELKEQSEE